MARTKIFVGSDHAGVGLKSQLLSTLARELPEMEWIDLGCKDESSTHYPLFAKAVAEHVVAENAKGLLICGSGIGMTIAANKVDGIRAAQAWDVTSARLSREHNDANILCFGARLTGFEVAREMCHVWLKTQFLGGRHQDRIELISKMESGK